MYELVNREGGWVVSAAFALGEAGKVVYETQTMVVVCFVSDDH